MKNTDNDIQIDRLLENGVLEDAKKMSMPLLQLMSYYRCAIMEIETKFNVLNEEFSLLHDRNPISSIKSRLKSMDSIYDKLSRKGLPCNLHTIENNLFDIAGIRVCCSFLDDVYTLSDALLRQNDITLIKKKDYIDNPKPNGYRSLHLIVSVPIFLTNETKHMKVEIQLRTIAMDSWASLEHQLRYKKDICFTDIMTDTLAQCANMSFEQDLQMNEMQRRVFKSSAKI